MVQIFGAVTRNIQRPYADITHLITASIVTRQNIFGPGVDDICVARIRRDVTALTASHGVPVLTTDNTVVIPARNRYGRIILLCSVDVIRKTIIRSDVIELGSWLILLRGPCSTTV